MLASLKSKFLPPRPPSSTQLRPGSRPRLHSPRPGRPQLQHLWNEEEVEVGSSEPILPSPSPDAAAHMDLLASAHVRALLEQVPKPALTPRPRAAPHPTPTPHRQLLQPPRPPRAPPEMARSSASDGKSNKACGPPSAHGPEWLVVSTSIISVTPMTTPTSVTTPRSHTSLWRHTAGIFNPCFSEEEPEAQRG